MRHHIHLVLAATCATVIGCLSPDTSGLFAANSGSSESANSTGTGTATGAGGHGGSSHSTSASSRMMTNTSTSTGTGVPADAGADVAVDSPIDAPSCAHNPCSGGGPLDPACSPCVDSICTLYPSLGCCTTGWTLSCAAA